ncbi:MAG: prepilin-type N-terminal cleavage/methylation domain-containing protein [Candidatus Nealsonbacteria bacterium]|nr:prepilin-type N-terminal cleavage/methylation domain-containing protein [Candidatus Nealsonbacteria bacterium]
MDWLKTAHKGEQGFTLIEVTVVMLIMTILAVIVVTSIGTSGTAAEKTAAIADANAITTALNRYNTDSRKSDWPEETISLNTSTHTFTYKGATVDGSTTFTVNSGGATATPKIAVTDAALADYTQLDWNATTQVRRETGHLTFSFIDDYLLSLPRSTQLKRDETDNYEYIFLLKKTQAEEGRIVELYQLNENGTSWEKIFP